MIALIGELTQINRIITRDNLETKIHVIVDGTDKKKICLKKEGPPKRKEEDFCMNE